MRNILEGVWKMRDIYDVILRRKSRPGSRGYQYDAIFGGGVLVSSRDPEYAACRALLAMGLTGTAQFWREGKACHDSSLDIERGARGTTQELNKGTIRVGKYTEFSWPDEGEEDAPEPELKMAA
jgi:hypothetical protein